MFIVGVLDFFWVNLSEEKGRSSKIYYILTRYCKYEGGCCISTVISSPYSDDVLCGCLYLCCLMVVNRYGWLKLTCCVVMRLSGCFMSVNASGI